MYLAAMGAGEVDIPAGRDIFFESLKTYQSNV